MSASTRVTPAGEIGRIRLLWQRRHWVLVAIILGAVGALIFLAIAAPIYMSTTVLSVGNVGHSQTDNSAQRENIDVLYSEAGVLKSSEVLARTLRLEEVKTLGVSADGTNAHTFLSDSIHVEVDRSSQTLHLSVSHTDPNAAAVIANALAQSYLELRSQRAIRAVASDKPNGKTAAFNRAPENPGLFWNAERTRRQVALDEFIKQNPEFIAANSADAIGERLKKLTEALTAAQIEAADADAAVKAFRSLPGDLSQVRHLLRSSKDKEIFGPLDQQSDQVENEIAPLEKQYTLQLKSIGPRNPVMLALRSKIDALKTTQNEIDLKRKNIYAAYVEHQATAATEKVNELRGLVDREKEVVRQHVVKAEQFGSLNSAVTEASLMLDNDISHSDPRPQEPAPAGISGGEATVVKVIKIAQPETVPVWPRRNIIVGVGMSLGLMCGIVLASIRPWRSSERNGTGARGTGSKSKSAAVALPV